MVRFGNDWDEVLRDLISSGLYAGIREFLKKEYSSHTVYPHMNDIFNALKYTPYENVRVVILGQDPYHEPGQAHGLAFSVKPGVEIPPSLRNVYKELNDDIGFRIPNHGCLTEWAKRGVLLLNTTLTVRAHMANSHKDCGWRSFTDEIIRLLSLREEPMVFLLWGAYARSKAPLIAPRHLVLQAPHPSPLSANNGFFGCRHFSKTNAFLADRAIDWSLDDI